MNLPSSPRLRWSLFSYFPRMYDMGMTYKQAVVPPVPQPHILSAPASHPLAMSTHYSSAHEHASTMTMPEPNAIAASIVPVLPFAFEPPGTVLPALSATVPPTASSSALKHGVPSQHSFDLSHSSVAATFSTCDNMVLTRQSTEMPFSSGPPPFCIPFGSGSPVQPSSTSPALSVPSTTTSSTAADGGRLLQQQLDLLRQQKLHITQQLQELERQNQLIQQSGSSFSPPQHTMTHPQPLSSPPQFHQFQQLSQQQFLHDQQQLRHQHRQPFLHLDPHPQHQANYRLHPPPPLSHQQQPRPRHAQSIAPWQNLQPQLSPSQPPQPIDMWQHINQTMCSEQTSQVRLSPSAQPIAASLFSEMQPLVRALWSFAFV
jgi:hypothetical protein